MFRFGLSASNTGELPFLSKRLLLVTLVLTCPATLAAYTPSGPREIHYINVQQGSSTLVIGPDGTTILRFIR